MEKIDFSVEGSKQSLIESLHKGPLKVTFTKKDGTERVMNCTLVDTFIEPNPSGLKAAPGRKKSEAAMPVWDIDAKAWRAFRWDSIISIEETK